MVTLTNTSDGSLDPDMSSATGTIQNDDEAGESLSIAAVSADKNEGNFGTVEFTFEVTRTGDFSQVTTVDYTTTGTGLHPADIQDFNTGWPLSDTLTFNIGEEKQTIKLHSKGDTVPEENEGFTVTLSNPSDGVSITQETAMGIIQNDDGTLVSIVDASHDEGSSGGTTDFIFTVSRTGDTTNDAVVSWEASAGGGGEEADSGDFINPVSEPLGGDVIIPAGQNSVEVKVPVLADTVHENNETFVVTLTNTSDGSLDPNMSSATGTIQNDDEEEAGTTLSIAALDAVKPEGQDGTYTKFTFEVTRSGDLDQVSTVDYTTTGTGVYPAERRRF